MTTKPRVLLVEDDASLQRFVALALDDLDIELQCCADVDQAIQALAGRPAQLILTDLMLPGRSGFDLIEMLGTQPVLRAGARLVVFSAGLTPPVRERLASHATVWRLLSKPCSVADLEQCVSEGAGLTLSLPTPKPLAVSPEISADSVAIERHFGGNTALYQAFRATCLRQFHADLKAGDEACAMADAAALRRLAHSLKSVLLTLGHEPASVLAHRLEDLAEQTLWPQVLGGWQALRVALVSVINDTKK